MKVCEHCLMEIESHEGEQMKKHLSYYDYEEEQTDDGELMCEWCEEYYDISDMYEI